MNLENLLSVPAISFRERMLNFSGSNTVKVCTHRSFVVNDTGQLVTKKAWEACLLGPKDNFIIHACLAEGKHNLQVEGDCLV